MRSLARALSAERDPSVAELRRERDRLALEREVEAGVQTILREASPSYAAMRRERDPEDLAFYTSLGTLVISNVEQLLRDAPAPLGACFCFRPAVRGTDRCSDHPRRPS